MLTLTVDFVKKEKKIGHGGHDKIRKPGNPTFTEGTNQSGWSGGPT
jgi:hypothetical protein